MRKAENNKIDIEAATVRSRVDLVEQTRSAPHSVPPQRVSNVKSVFSKKRDDLLMDIVRHFNFRSDITRKVLKMRLHKIQLTTGPMSSVMSSNPLRRAASAGIMKITDARIALRISQVLFKPGLMDADEWPERHFCETHPNRQQLLSSGQPSYTVAYILGCKVAKTCSS